MGKFADLTGQTFGRLTILSEFKRGRHRYVTCLCSCGNTTDARKSHVTTGRIKSCNCYNSELRVARSIKHRESPRVQRTKEYRAWESMRSRCYNQNDKKYPNYGGRGISVCNRWLHSVTTFLKDMGRAPSVRHSLDRKDVNGNYEPGNCRWATNKEQANNRRSNNHIEYLGKTFNLAQWCEFLGIPYKRTQLRLQKGWSVEQAFTLPARTFRRESQA